MKSYTDIEQSKMLAEILPLESADMFIADVFLEEKQTHSYKFHFLTTWGHKNFDELKERENKFVQFIPCWSLATLLRLMPKEINILGTIYSINIHTKNEKWFIDYKCNNEEFVGVYSNIFVDACYKMILDLHGLKML